MGVVGVRGGCESCGLYKNCASYIIKPKQDRRILDSDINPILIVSGYPTPKEDRDNEVRFDENYFLAQFLEALEIPYVLTHAVACHPGTDEAGKYLKPTQHQVEMCRPILMQTIIDYKPSCIVWLGRVAMDAIFGEDAPKTIKMGAGMSDVTIGGIPVIGSYSPGMHGSSMNLINTYITLFTKAEKLAKGELAEVPFEHQVHRKPSDVPPIPDDLDTPIFLDVEVRQSKDHPEMISMHHKKAKLICTGYGYFHKGKYHQHVLTPTATTNGVIKRLFKGQWVYAHNTKYDFSAIRRFTGIDLYDIIKDSGDTFLDFYSFDIGARGNSLKQLAADNLNAPDWASGIWDHIDAGKKRRKDLLKAAKEAGLVLDDPYVYSSFEDIPEELLYEYNAKDVFWTARLWHEVLIEHERYDDYIESPAYSLLKDATQFLMDVEFNGLPIDLEMLGKVADDVRARIDVEQERLSQHEDIIAATKGFAVPKELANFEIGKLWDTELGMYFCKPASFNVKSNLFLSNLAMYTGHHTGETSKTTGMLSFTKEILQAIGGIYPLVVDGRTRHQDLWKDVYDLRQLRTTLSSLESLPKYIVDGRIRSNYRMASTVTSRLSSADPNLQNIGKYSGIRKIFKAPKGWKFVSCDYDRIELVFLAFLAGEETMLKAVRNGVDLHQLTADLLGVTRDLAKTANFGIVYGQTAKAFAATAGITLEEANTFFKNFFKLYSNIPDYYASVDRKVKAGQAIVTKWGRRREFVLTGRYKSDGQIQRQSRNMELQSTASDTTLAAGCRVNKKLKAAGLYEYAYPINIVHDDVVYLVKEEYLPRVAKLIQEEMSRTDILPFELTVPLNVGLKVGDNWEEANEGNPTGLKEYKLDVSAS